MSTAVRSYAKINLGLYIGAPRPDGYHSLATVYQTLELHDLVSVAVRIPVPRPAWGGNQTTIRVTSNDARVPADGRNTAWKMVALVLEELDMTAEVEIHIEKRLPVQGGLGAGSANAVAALVEFELAVGVDGKKIEGWFVPGRSALWEWGRRRGLGDCNGETLMAHWGARRLELAAKVGSDVPLFLIGGAVLGLDRGQEVYPLPDFEPVWCVVATPEIGVSTPQAFRDWDALCQAEGLTPEASHAKLNELSRAYASAFAEAIPGGRYGTGSFGVLSAGKDLAGPQESALVRTGITRWIQNDFERVVFPQQPSLAEIKRILLGFGTPEAALHASLSGSGSALFGLYSTRGDAEAARERLRTAGVASTLTRTLPRSAYWREMLVQDAI
jgi:4-diphosphocytidyl-2-C-methyl-D-erythritol kinase